METHQQIQGVFTKANVGTACAPNKGKVLLSVKEATEYCEYKKQKNRANVRVAVLKSEGILEDFREIKKICERALKYRQASVRMSPIALEYARPWITASALKVDCLIGGNGETLSKVKAYEAKRALRLRAKELTVVISPSMLQESRYGGIRKELKRLRKVSGRAVLKAKITGRVTPDRLAHLCKICSEIGVDYLSVPIYDGCERLKSGLSGKCRLEVYGVETLEQYKKMVSCGVERIVTNRIEEIQSDWLKEVDAESVFALLNEGEEKTAKENEKEQDEQGGEKAKDTDTCRDE